MQRSHQAMMTFTARALGIPHSAAEVLARSGYWQTRRAVAQNPDAASDVVEELLEDPHQTVRTAAYRHVKNVAVLDVTEETSPRRSEAVAKNPATPVAALERLLRHQSPQVVRAAMSNPNTPDACVLAAAQDWASTALFNTGSTTYIAAGVGVVMRHHPCVATVWHSDPNSITRRSLLKDPRLPLEVLDHLPRVGRGGWGRAIALNPYIPRDAHPAASGIERDSLEELLDGRSPWEMISEASGRDKVALFPSATLHQEVAGAQLGREAVLRFLQGVVTLRGQDQITADTLADLVDQGGYQAAAHAALNLGITRIKSTTEISEVLGTYDPTAALVDQQDPDAAGDLLAETFHSLGEDKDAWESYVALGINWQGTLAELGEAVQLVHK